MSKSLLVIDTPNTCGDCPLSIHTAEEKRYVGYCNTSDEDYYCTALDRFMEYDIVDDGLDILGKPVDCPLQIDVLEKQMNSSDTISRQAVLDQTYLWSKDEFLRVTNPFDYLRKRINSLPPVTPQPKNYAELKREFLRMASYIDTLLECSDEQKETLIGFISRLAEFMPWTERDDKE